MQITKAMQLVASSKLRKAKEKADKARPFFDTLYETMCEIANENTDYSNPYTAGRVIKNVVLIVIAGDRGLAGGFNSNNLKIATARAEKLISEGKGVKILAIGKKAVEYFAKRKYKVIETYQGIAEGINIYDAMTISSNVVNIFKKKECDSVELYYTTYVSALVQEPANFVLLPISNENKAEKTKAEELTEYEPSAAAVFEEIIPKYLTGIVYSAVVDSFAAEQASRRSAMESATDNANKMISDLSLKYNKARQSVITQEITEIVGGAKT